MQTSPPLSQPLRNSPLPRFPGHKCWPLYPLHLSEIALFKKAWPALSRFVPGCACAADLIHDNTAQIKANMTNHTARPHKVKTAKTLKEEPHKRGHRSPRTIYYTQAGQDNALNGNIKTGNNDDK